MGLPRNMVRTTTSPHGRPIVDAGTRLGVSAMVVDVVVVMGGAGFVVEVTAGSGSSEVGAAIGSPAVSVDPTLHEVRIVAHANRTRSGRCVITGL